MHAGGGGSVVRVPGAGGVRVGASELLRVGAAGGQGAAQERGRGRPARLHPAAGEGAGGRRLRGKLGVHGGRVGLAEPAHVHGVLLRALRQRVRARRLSPVAPSHFTPTSVSSSSRSRSIDCKGLSEFNASKMPPCGCTIRGVSSGPSARSSCPLEVYHVATYQATVLVAARSHSASLSPSLSRSSDPRRTRERRAQGSEEPHCFSLKGELPQASRAGFQKLSETSLLAP